MFTKLESDKQADMPGFVDFLVASIAMKKTVGISTQDYINSMRQWQRGL
jgi:hypothetical protein